MERNLRGRRRVKVVQGSDLARIARSVLPAPAARRWLAPQPKREQLIAREEGYILYIEGISVTFDGFRALNDLTLYVETGELRCVIGPNGAGKTTMMDVITGKTRPDEGSAYFGQTIDLLAMSEPEIASAGIGRKFQKPTVFENLSVFENLELAMAADKRVWPTLVATLSGENRDRIGSVLETIGLRERAHAQAGLLSHGEKQWLEIGMLLMQNPRMLLVDEPVAGMTKQESEATAELLTRLAGEHSVLVVEHDMEFVRSIARRVTVLHEGSVLAEGAFDEVQNDQRVIEVYLGS
ncbi:MAG: urea ABC transporter ATP-binding protein UrtD [Gammaproteobacteria bacterium]|nr:urea ABC transporter ATP-binding protein UrtD [Gammaproteobacteria bacterium]MBS03808.1 urea ABC transporter ATP-binding protein UrtD [Gammaproteobacteria bacterium]|tara:strand:+ start:4931 stop:5815 length:885 start_codon:yes stop_codon:yes gene_type:complete